jgi:predicted aspartyl protease
MRLPFSHRVDPTGTIRLVGMTFIASTVRRPEGRGRGVRVRFVVDSGAVYSVLPEPVWKRLRLRPTRSAQFSLADGTVIERGVSRCTFEIAGVSETSPVVLGGPRDAPLLGMVTLEALGLMLNPLTRELLPMKLLLARLTPRAA